MSSDNRFDVVIIGGGVIGSALARELSRYELKIAVLEKNPDVCYETSGRNTGVCHGGFAYDVGSLKARFCVEGNRMMDQLAKELDFPFKRTGKVLVGNTPEEYERLLEVIAQGEANGATGMRMLDEEELLRMVPGVVGKFAMFSENSGILDPFLMTIALAENAVQNGVVYFLQHEVTDIQRNSDEYEITAAGDIFRARWVINAAGLGCGKISDLLGIKGYHIIGSKDDYILLDRRLGKNLPMPIYTVPSNTYMGIHVTVTTDENVLLGPTAEQTDNLSWYGVEPKNLDYLYREAQTIWPHFTKADYIRTYSGILPKLVDEEGTIQDYRIEIRDDIAPNAVNLIGIESPGLTAAAAIAKYTAGMMMEREEFQENPNFNPYRHGIRRFADMSEEEQAEAIRENADYGELVCRCQKVTRAELLQAVHNPLGVHTVTGVKYRTRAMMGRCQGGYCQMRITQLLEKELGIPAEKILYAREGSNMFYGKVREQAEPKEEGETQQVDVLIVGGGPAGLAAAVRLYEKGIRKILIVERENRLGGILRQCIHDGFGLTRFGESLSGPEYAKRFIDEVKERNIPYITGAAVTNITPDRKVTVVTRTGLQIFSAGAVILAMGCRERTRGALAIPGERPAGVYTAGVAQAYINLYNRMPAKEAVILGSGDIGMIMARRLTLEGVHVKAVFEVMPYPSGLPRNIQQCLKDYDIPLYLSHTVTEIHGDTRLKGITVSEVDEHLQPVPGTEQYYECDTLILSVGLIPENELSLEAGVELDPRTKGACVDEHFQTSVPGIFSAGNVLHVHDLVDFVSMEAESLADHAARYLEGESAGPGTCRILCGEGIHHTVPQMTSGAEPFVLSLRVTKPMSDVKIEVRQGEKVVGSRKMKKALPAEMIRLKVTPDTENSGAQWTAAIAE